MNREVEAGLGTQEVLWRVIIHLLGKTSTFCNCECRFDKNYKKQWYDPDLNKYLKCRRTIKY